MTKSILTALLLCAAAGAARAETSPTAVENAMELADTQLYYAPNKPPRPEDIAAKGYTDGAGDTMIHIAEACAATVDAAIAEGSSPDTTVEVHGVKVTYAEGRTRYCEALLEHGKQLEALLDAEAEAARKALYAKYEAHGIKGDRLELFVYYDGTGWYTRGCQYTVDEPADLARAKVLFHWLDNSDGSITIRKYRFKKNRYTFSEKVYWRSDKAYRGCR
jgi:hypothetical protein